MKTREHWADGVKVSTRAISVVGLSSIVLFAAGFGAWAAYAPLAGAAIVPGFVAASGQNQKVQHLEGGLIAEILVREGEVVTKGQTLFRLDPTNALAQRNQLVNQSVSLSARAIRLVAERDGEPKLVFPETLKAMAAADRIEDVLQEQDKEFVVRLERHRQEGVILRQRVNALTEQIEGLAAQQTAVESQLKVVEEETLRKKLLLDKGLTDRSEYTALLRSEAELIGQLGQAKSSILSARTQIVEAEEQYARLDTQRIETAASQLNDVRSQISSVDEELRAMKAILDRTEVRSPSDGIVITMHYNTFGSVVKPGDLMLELLPTGEDLMIEGRVSPQDIDVVRVGQEADLHFSALNTNITPVVPATVTYVSADRLLDPQNQQPYYSARFRITGDLPPEIETSKIYPGMPVEGFIRTGTRSFFEYLGKPISDSFSRAFREE